MDTHGGETGALEKGRAPVRGKRRASMPPWAVLATVLAIGSALFGLPVSQAAAAQVSDEQELGIPDVAIVTRSDTGRTTALRSGNSLFALVWQLLQPTYRGTTRVSQAWDEGSYPAVRATVVWALTGVGGGPGTGGPPGGQAVLEQHDQLFLADDGTPWVRSDAAPDVEDGDIRWHRTSRATFDQLERLGLVGAPPQRHPTPKPAPDRADALRWAIPGLALGTVLGAAGTALIRRAAILQDAGPPRSEPRQELIDL
ncbi:hypothetical protein [Streptomyces sp. NPDC018693]|uniref:hypothetical protein n=1 Tax=unclassified Streptomyces TaxID=2593676 RepID=UPI0037974925